MHIYIFIYIPQKRFNIIFIFKHIHSKDDRYFCGIMFIGVSVLNQIDVIQIGLIVYVLTILIISMY
jgi:hypothetical protein